MKLLSFLLLMACTALAQTTTGQATTATTAKTDVERRGFHGPVRSVHEEVTGRCDPVNPAICPPPFQVNETTFTPDGWITESLSMAHNELVGRIVWQRDGARLIRMEAVSNRPQLAQKQVTTYDEQGRPIELLTYDLNGKLRERTVRQYREEGIVESTYDGDGHLIDTYIRHTNETKSAGTTTSETRTDNELESRTVVTPTADGKRSDTSSYGRDGNVSLHTVEEVGPEGTKATLTSKYGTGLEVTKDPAGNVLTQIVHDDRGSTKNYYEPVGRWTRTERYDLNGKLLSASSFTYEDDDHGNWIRRRNTSAMPGRTPQVLNVATRTISYY